MAVSRLMRSGVRFKSVAILTDLIGSVKGWRCFKVRHPRRRSDRRVSEGVCGVFGFGETDWKVRSTLVRGGGWGIGGIAGMGASVGFLVLGKRTGKSVLRW